MSTKELKPYLLLITYAGVVFLAVTHLDRILGFRFGQRLCWY